MSKYTAILLILFASISSHSVLAMSYMGLGVDKSLAQAKQLALSDLQQNLYVYVETNTHVERGSQIANYYRLTSKLSSQLQIIGTQNDCLRVNDEHHCTVELGEAQAELYAVKISRLIRQINDHWAITQQAKGRDKFDRLQQLLLLHEQLKTIAVVYELLAPDKPISGLKVSETQINSALANIQSRPSNVDELAIAIATPLKQYRRIFVKPFTPLESLEITPFSRTLRAKIISHLDVISDRDYAFYELSGNYSYNKKHISVQNHLMALVKEKHKQIVHANSQQLTLDSISNLDYLPKSLEFDRQLIKEHIIGNNFKIQLKTNKGSRDLLFEQNQTVKLLIKLSHPGYFYLVGHSQNKNKSQSYLVDLNDSSDNQKFVHYLGVEQINRWVDIGQFDVTAPYGSESIQAFGSVDYPGELLPTTQFNGTYYIIDGSFSQVTRKTRGLVRKSRLIKPEPKTILAQQIKTDAVEITDKTSSTQNSSPQPTNKLSKNNEYNSETFENTVNTNKVAEAVLKFTTYGTAP